MNETARKRIVWVLFSAWILLAAFFLVERAGYLNDTDEYAGQGIEQTISVPAHIDHQNLDELLATFVLISFISFAAAFSLKPVPQGCLPILIKEYRPPGPQKIYQFISTYRI